MVCSDDNDDGFHDDWETPMRYNATHNFEESNWDAQHTTTTLEPPLTPFSTIVQPKPSSSTNPPLESQASSQPNFLSVVTAEDSTGTTRPDAYYVPPKDKRHHHKVILAFNTSIRNPEPTEHETDQNSEQPQIETVLISARLMLPIKNAKLASREWWNKKRRDEAATWINTNLGTLYTEGALPGCLADRGFLTHSGLMREDGNRFRAQLRLLLQSDENLTPTSDGPADPTSGPSTSASKTPRKPQITVGSDTFDLVIRQTVNTLAWTDGQFYPDLETPLKALTKHQRYPDPLDNAQMEKYRKSIKESIESQSHITHEARCIFGDAVLCGPDAPRTIASTSTAAS